MITPDELVALNLPPLPPEADDDDTEARELVLAREDRESVVIAQSVSYDDAREYCSREDTHGDGWFVFFDPKGTH